MEDLSDVARVHFGIRIKCFNVLDVKNWNIIIGEKKESELDEKINDVYRKMKLQSIPEEEVKNRLIKLADYLKKRQKTNTKQEIEKRVRILNWFNKLYSEVNDNIEKYQFTKKYDHYLFDDFPKGTVQTTYIYNLSNNSVKLLKVYRIKDVENNIYFYIQGNKSIKEYKISEIKEKIETETWTLNHPTQKELFFGFDGAKSLKIKRIK